MDLTIISIKILEVREKLHMDKRIGIPKYNFISIGDLYILFLPDTTGLSSFAKLNYFSIQFECITDFGPLTHFTYSSYSFSV